VTLHEVGYLRLDGHTVLPEAKGYICPLGQVCVVRVGFLLFYDLFFWRDFENEMNG